MSRRGNAAYWSHGELYIAGQRIEKSGRPTGSSRGATPPSVVSAYDTRDAHRPPSRFGSYPPQAESSREKFRYTQGYPNTLFGGGSQGSAPIHNARTNDYYREAIKPQPYNHGYSKDSRFKTQYNKYKDLNEAAQAYDKDVYKAHLATAPNVTKKKRAAQPGVYVGEPQATREWHGTAARYAQSSSRRYQESAQLRHEHARDFIGYDTQKGAKDHRKHTQILSSQGQKMEERAGRHRSYNLK